MRAIASVLVWAIVGLILGWLFLSGYALLGSMPVEGGVELLGQLRLFAFVLFLVFVGNLVNSSLLEWFYPNLPGALFLVFLMVTLSWGSVQVHDYQSWLATRPATTSEVLKTPLAWWASTSDNEMAVKMGSRRRGTSEYSFPRWAIALMMWGVPSAALLKGTWDWYMEPAVESGDE